jgi:putative Ca2+/H+ antiporter (TMEM165/GDT1 family)
MHSTPALFATVFGLIFVAELPDKTALAALVLATRHRPLPVFLGAALALSIQSAIAVGAGSLFAELPARYVHIGAGVVFLGCAIFMWRRKHEEDGEELKQAEGAGFWRALWTVFGVVFIAEWGDLTQVGTAALQAKYHAWVVVLTASTAALWCVTGIAVFVGNRARKVLEPKLTQNIAAALFAIIGVLLLAGLF